jgi:hypothetical protein
MLGKLGEYYLRRSCFVDEEGEMGLLIVAPLRITGPGSIVGLPKSDLISISATRRGLIDPYHSTPVSLPPAFVRHRYRVCGGEKGCQ